MTDLKEIIETHYAEINPKIRDFYDEFKTEKTDDDSATFNDMLKYLKLSSIPFGKFDKMVIAAMNEKYIPLKTKVSLGSHLLVKYAAAVYAGTQLTEKLFY